MGGFAAQLSGLDANQALPSSASAWLFVTVVNVHDLLAHMAGIDYRFELMGSDTQLALVEYAAPSIQALGSILTLLGILIFLVQVPLRFSLKNRA